jgi:tetrahydromethanopterin S-methyltransferase subunit B
LTEEECKKKVLNEVRQYADVPTELEDHIFYSMKKIFEEIKKTRSAKR